MQRERGSSSIDYTYIYSYNFIFWHLFIFRFGRIEGVKILPQKYPNIGVAAFIDFYDIKSAIDAKETKHVINGCELRTNFKAKPTEKFDGKKRPADGLLSTDKQENVRGSARYRICVLIVKATVVESLCSQVTQALFSIV